MHKLTTVEFFFYAEIAFICSKFVRGIASTDVINNDGFLFHQQCDTDDNIKY